MNRRSASIALTLLLPAAALLAADDVRHGPPALPDGKIVFRIATATNEDPAAAGRSAAEALKKAMGEDRLSAVIVSECFEDQEAKEKLIAGVCSVIPKEIVVGAATYGSFSQAGCCDADSVCLLGIGGDGIAASAALVTGLGTAKLTFQEHQQEIETKMRAAGKALAEKLPRGPHDRLLIVLADAHSPKNQPLVEGVQQAVGKQFPITGGSANKNAGQTFVYFGGKLYTDSAAVVVLSGDFRVSLAGRQAKENDKIIATARQSAAEAMAKVKGKPLAALAFDCAGRRGKLKRIEDELAAIQKALGKELPLFGCYCAGEVGPVDTEEKQPGVLSGGSGWHVMFTVISKE